jgi:hypothetical protein
LVLEGIIVDLRGGGPGGGSAATRRKRKEKQDEKFDLRKEAFAVLHDKGQQGDLVSKLEAVLSKAKGLRQLRREAATTKAEERRQEPKQEVKHGPKQRDGAVVKQSFYTNLIKPKATTAAEKNKPEGEQKTRRPRLLPGVWSRILLPDEVAKCLDEGRPPVGDAVVCTVAEAAQWRRLAETHDMKVALKLLIYDVTADAEAPAGAATVWASFDTGVRKVWSLDLVAGAAPVVQRSPQVQKVAVPASATVAWTVLRCTLAREFVTAEAWKQARSKPGDALKAACAERVEMMTYGWKHEVVQSRDRLVGYARVKTTEVNKVLGASGRRAWFLRRLQTDTAAADRPPAWIRKEASEKDEEYFSRCAAEAAAAAKPLAFRQGGGSALGIAGGGGNDGERYVMFGAPRDWSPEVLKEVLTAWGWRGLRGIVGARFKGDGTLFTAKLPEKTEDGCKEFVYELEGLDGLVSIRPWVAAPRGATKSHKLGVKSAWQTPAADGAAADTPQSGDKRDGVETQAAEGGTSAAAKKMRTEAGAKATTEVPSVAVVAAAARPAKVPPGPAGTTLLDLGGNGDCAYRAIAGALARKNKGNLDEVKGVLPTLVKSLKAVMVGHLETTKEKWSESWRYDAAATELEEAGPIPKTAGEWLEAVKSRGRRWACARTMAACAEAKRVDILVFTWEGGKWKPKARFLAGKKPKDEVIAVALRDRHFYAIDGVKPEWAKEPGEIASPVEYFTGRAGGGRRRRAASEAGSASSGTLVRRLLRGGRPTSCSMGASGRSAASSETAVVRRLLQPGSTSAAASSSRTRRCTSSRVPTASSPRDALTEPIGNAMADAVAEVHEPGSHWACPCGWRPPCGGSRGQSAAVTHWRSCQGTRPPRLTAEQKACRVFKGPGPQARAAQCRQRFEEWRLSLEPAVAAATCRPNLEVPFVCETASGAKMAYACGQCGQQRLLSDFRRLPCPARTPAGEGGMTRREWLTAVLGPEVVRRQEEAHKRVQRRLRGSVEGKAKVKEWNQQQYKRRKLLEQQCRKRPAASIS